MTMIPMQSAVAHDLLSSPRHQRSHGQASVSLAQVDGAARLGRLRQVGSAKAILPQVHAPVPEVVFLNTSGGLTGGDRLSYALDLGPGTKAVATTQTAERAYAAGPGQATVDVRFRVGARGHLDWLPQETILYNGASLARQTKVALAPGASCLLLEAVVLGRAAMGETVAQVMLSDRRIVRRDGRLIHLEPANLTDAMLGARAALLGPARAFASIVAIGPDSTDLLVPVRGVLDGADVVGGASALGERLSVRLMASDALALRRRLVVVLGVLRRGRPLPRVWQI